MSATANRAAEPTAAEERRDRAGSNGGAQDAAIQRLHVERIGSGEPLVLLHGIGESLVGWRPVMDQLAAEYDVIAVDLPGFGRSPVLPAGMAPAASNLATAVHDTLAAIGVGDFHVAGYSLGGRVALKMADSASVRSVVAISPDGLGTPPERAMSYLTLLVGRSVAAALAPAARALSATPAGRAAFFVGNRTLPWQLTRDDHEELLTGFAGSPGFHPAALTALFDAPDLHIITQPVLFLQGTADPVTGHVPRFLPLIPRAQLRLLPGIKHVPISDVPNAVARNMLGFLRDADDTSGEADRAEVARPQIAG